jgi:hypothetical protein
MATPGFPLPLRNALAELALAALTDADALRALHWLVAPAGPPPPAAAARLASVHLVDPGGETLLGVHAPHAQAVAAHAARAARAARRVDPTQGVDRITRACRHARALWSEGLFFEVHEVLEAAWKTATGAERQALQGVIQIAVAFHHFAHGNVRGARSLLCEGRSRVADVPHDTLPDVDLARLFADTTAWEIALAAGDAPPGEPPPLARR